MIIAECATESKCDGTEEMRARTSKVKETTCKMLRMDVQSARGIGCKRFETGGVRYSY